MRHIQQGEGGQFLINHTGIRRKNHLRKKYGQHGGGEVFAGVVGGGATRQTAGGDPQPIAVQRPCASPVRVVGSRSHANPKLDQCLRDIGPYEMASMGSSLKFCLVAEGQADLYPRLGLTSEWDTAAAQCIVEQAGGHVTRTDMSVLEYNTKDSLLNPFFFVFGSDRQDWSRFLG